MTIADHSAARGTAPARFTHAAAIAPLLSLMCRLARRVGILDRPSIHHTMRGSRSMDDTRPQAPPAGEIVCIRRRVIDAVAADWDRFVPRDVPHLRAGFLRAVERGGVVNKPAYLLAYRAGRPVGAAVVYSLLLDTTMPAPPHVRRFISRIRERAPGFLRRSMLIFVSPITNPQNGMWLDPELRSE